MYTSDERLYVNEDKSKVVREGDPEARYLLVAEGGELPDDEAARYGLTGTKDAAPEADHDDQDAPAPVEEVAPAEHEAAEKAQAPAANKARKPAEDK